MLRGFLFNYSPHNQIRGIDIPPGCFATPTGCFAISKIVGKGSRQIPDQNNYSTNVLFYKRKKGKNSIPKDTAEP
jgi:hypothetical protein